MSRVVVIGDIHGALKALGQIVLKLELHPEDKLIFLGDYVDGWPQSAGVIDYLIALETTCRCVFVKGNHDVWCESWLDTGIAEDDWLNNNGQSTIDSYRDFDGSAKREHLAFFNRMRKYYVDEENRLFVHAGFTSMKGPSEEGCEASFSNDRTLLETALSLDHRIANDSIFYPPRLLLFQEVYIGHTPTLKYDVTTPMQLSGLCCMDTGAATKGRISAMDINTKEFWQSDTTPELYLSGR